MLNSYSSSSYLLYAYCTNSYFYLVNLLFPQITCLISIIFIYSMLNIIYLLTILVRAVLILNNDLFNGNFWSKSSTCSKYYETISLCISTPNFCGNSSTCNKYQMFTYSTTNYYFLHNFGVRVVLALYFYYSTISYTI